LKGNGEIIKRLLREVEHDIQVDASTDHFLAYSLKGGKQAFIDRQELRETLRSFVDNREMIALLVDGDQGSGRSYTYELIRHLGPLNGFRPWRVLLGRTTTAQKLLQEIAYCVCEDADSAKMLWHEPKQSMDSAVQWVISKAIADSRHPWLVLDDCNKLDQNSDVWDCISNLVLTIYNWSAGEPHVPRLVLLGYAEAARQLPHEVRHSLARDTARVVEEEDLRAFFARHFGEVTPRLASGAPVSTSEIPGLVKQAVDEVLKQANEHANGDGCFMRRICTAVEGAIRAYQ
jgi:hypothetical protein